MAVLYRAYCTFFPSVLSSFLIRTYESTILRFNILRLKMTTNSDDVAVLNERLKKAEKRLKMLTCEINDIKLKIHAIQHNSVSQNSTRLFSTNTTVGAYGDESDYGNSNPAKRMKIDFPMEDEYVVVYTDGACENNGKFNAKAGLGVWFADNHPLNISRPVSGRATNNVGEIQACIEAVKIACENGITKLCIKTDSEFVINSMTKWIKKWKKNSWKLSSGGDVKNKEDFMALDQQSQKLQDLKWVHVNGHQGIKGNEEADKLARNGALSYVRK